MLVQGAACAAAVDYRQGDASKQPAQTGAVKVDKASPAAEKTLKNGDVAAKAANAKAADGSVRK